MWRPTAFGNLTRSYLREVWALHHPYLDGLPLMGDADGDGEDWIFRLGAVVAISVVYSFLSVSVGPSLMRDRRPFQAREALLAYNAAQVAINLVPFALFVASFRPREFDFLCQPVDYSGDPEQIHMIRIGYAAMPIKLLDLLDTAFFVLRKKNNQITFLHVYHHAVMPVYIWIVLSFTPGGNNTIPLAINCFVHILMYSYYFMAALGPRYRWMLIWKRWMTTAQILQFLFILGHTGLQFFIDDCGHPIEQTLAQAFLIASFLILFINYYIQEYIFKTNAIMHTFVSDRETNLKKQA